MSNSSWQTHITAHLAAQTTRRRWSRRSTLALAAVVLILLYAGLLFATSGNAQAAQPSAPAAQAAPTQMPTDETGDPDQTQGAVSPALLAEFDRLNRGQVEDTSPDPGVETTETPSLVSTLFFSLLFIVAVIYGGVWLYKRYTLATNPAGLPAGMRLLSVQESQSIGPNQKLHLVRMGNELLLIGATEQNISFLARYDGEATSDTFAEHLQGAIRPDSGQGSADLGERLRQLRNLGQPGLRGGGND